MKHSMTYHRSELDLPLDDLLQQMKDNNTFFEKNNIENIGITYSHLNKWYKVITDGNR
ncbi:MAG: hypothetical protein ACTSP4_15780 [Candidatus Hodarchaeales archaeon]